MTLIDFIKHSPGCTYARFIEGIRFYGEKPAPRKRRYYKKEQIIELKSSAHHRAEEKYCTLEHLRELLNNYYTALQKEGEYYASIGI